MVEEQTAGQLKRGDRTRIWDAEVIVVKTEAIVAEGVTAVSYVRAADADLPRPRVFRSSFSTDMEAFTVRGNIADAIKHLS
jgi:hypothetical protein